MELNELLRQRQIALINAENTYFGGKDHGFCLVRHYARPALPDAIEDRLRTCAIRDVGRSQIDHQQAATGVDGDVAFAPDDLLGCVEPADLRCRKVDQSADFVRAAGGDPAATNLVVGVRLWF